ncbi:MAG: glutaminyl-peptide cyclotransferase [Chloroflexi bacterium]|nr:glutaminyl-peptide cyclotransferase [Chloroflexota bacterium]
MAARQPPATLDATPAVTPEATAEPVELLVPEVLDTFPHDPASFLQGLVLHDGLFYESAGQYGQSSLRQVEPETGDVLRRVDVPAQYFAEGLALVDDRLIQITWKEQTALVYDLETFEQVDTFTYEGEGWGLCYDGDRLYMSDGTDTLTIRDPETFEVTGDLTVMLEGQPVSAWSFQGSPLDLLNELECVGDDIYANIWQTDLIARIDKTTGSITAMIYAGDLLTPEERQALFAQGGVLNGIAYDPDDDTFYITGKRWPKLFKVRFVPAE